MRTGSERGGVRVAAGSQGEEKRGGVPDHERREDRRPYPTSGDP